MKVIVLIFRSWSRCRCSLRSSSESRVQRRPSSRYSASWEWCLANSSGIWIQTKKLDVPRAASVCLVGETLRPAASIRNALADGSRPEVASSELVIAI